MMRVPLLFLGVALLGVGTPAPGAAPVTLVPDAVASQALLAKLSAPATCVVADLAKGDAGVLFQGESAVALPAGRYRLHAPVAASPLGTLALGTVRLRITAADATRDCSAVQFPASDEFADLGLEFILKTTARVPVRIDWRAEEGTKTKGLLGRRALELHQAAGKGGPPATTGLGDEDGGAAEPLKLDDEGAGIAFAEAKKVPFHLLATAVHIERLSPIDVRVRLDKLVYRPRDEASATVTLKNLGAAPFSGTLTLELCAGLQPPQPLKTQPVELAAGQETSLPFARLLPTQNLHWGADVQATVTGAGVPPASGHEVFAVSSNLWETAIIAAHPAHMAAFDRKADAETAARKLRDQGFTGFEAFFWAPCDLLEFTPDQELFFSGQTAYPGTVTGTRNLIAACHAEGLYATFYANLWGGSGPPAIEVMRRHPEWFGDANYNTFVLDDWDLLGPSQMDMGAHKLRAPGIATWCFNQLYIAPPEGVFRYHANEILSSRKMFGWDGIRYDSYYSRYWSVRAMRLIRGLVAKDAPEFGFGYNSFAWADYKAGALDDMIGGGGLIMGEGIRIEGIRSLEKFAREINSWRDVIWAYGGHGPGMLFRDSTDEEEMTPLGVDYQASIILAAGGHLYYNPVKSELGQYPRCALRYSEFLYDNRMRPLRQPEAVVSFGRDARFLCWRELARTLDLGGNRHRLVLELLQQPIEQDPFKDKTMKAPPPLRALPVTLHLPPGAKVTGAWSFSPVPDARHQPLTATAAGDGVQIVVPEIRLWTALVVEFDAAAPLASPVSYKEKSDSCIQDWQVIGPFPNTVEMTAVKTAFPPEEKVELAAQYPGRDGKPVRWRRTLTPGQPALGRLPLDFRDALDDHSGAAGCAYAFTEITSDREREVWLVGKADDTLALWVNGAKVEFQGGQGEFQDVDEGRAKITLRAGRNQLLAKVCEKWLYWLLALRVADADGNPVTDGVTVSAESAK